MFKVTTPYVRISICKINGSKSDAVTLDLVCHSRSRRLRDSEFDFRYLLRMENRSINRASLRRSSLGFPKNAYIWPSEPWIVIFFGCAKEDMTSISSKNSEVTKCEIKPDTLDHIHTLEFGRVDWEWLVISCRRSSRWEVDDERLL